MPAAAPERPVVGQKRISHVMFHVAITSRVPPVGDLTLADKLMLVVYGFLFVTLAYNFILLDLAQHNREDMARRAHALVRHKVVAVVPAIFAVLMWMMYGDVWAGVLLPTP